MHGYLPRRVVGAVLHPGEVGAQDAEHGGYVGGVELARLAVTAEMELDDVQVSHADLAPRGGRWPGRC